MKKEADLWQTREVKNRYKVYRNQVTNTLKKAKFDWMRDHLTVDDSKKWWGRVKRLAGLVKAGGEDMIIKTEDGRELTKPAELAEHFNNFFKDKVTKLQSTIKIDREAVVDYAKEYMEEKGFKQAPEFTFTTMGTGVVNKIIKSLKNTSAEGRDQISTVLLKKFKGTIGPSDEAHRQCINQDWYLPLTLEGGVNNTSAEGWRSLSVKKLAPSSYKHKC